MPSREDYRVIAMILRNVHARREARLAAEASEEAVVAGVDGQTATARAPTDGNGDPGSRAAVVTSERTPSTGPKPKAAPS
jgi:hypothetical protein